MSGMKSWSTTPANNVLANTGFTMDEGQAPSTVNDSVRQLMADVRAEWAQGANIASAATVDLSTATGGYVHITGTVTITAFGTVSAGIRRKITFDGSLTVTHNATSLILPTGVSIVTVAGDTCEVMSEGSGNWRMLWYAGKNVQAAGVNAGGATPVTGVGFITKGVDGTTSYIAQQILSGTSGNGAFTQYSDGATFNTAVGVDPTTGDWSLYDGRFPGTAGTKRFSIVRATGGTFWGTGTANFGTITKRKTADESVTSSTVLQDDDHLTFAIAANEEWVADFDLDVGGNLALHGIKVAITVPSGATLNVAASIVGPGPSGTGAANATNGRTTTSGAAIDLGLIFFGSSATGLMRLSAWALNGATPGNVTLQFAQSTSNGTAVKLFKGSHMQATRVA